MWRDINVGLTDSRLVVRARSQRGVQLIAAVGGKNTTAILFFFCSFFELKSKKVFYVFHHGGKKSYLLLFFCQTGGEHALISPLFTSCAIFFGDTRFIFIFSLWKRPLLSLKVKPSGGCIREAALILLQLFNLGQRQSTIKDSLQNEISTHRQKEWKKEQKSYIPNHNRNYIINSGCVKSNYFKIKQYCQSIKVQFVQIFGQFTTTAIWRLKTRNIHYEQIWSFCNGSFSETPIELMAYRWDLEDDVIKTLDFDFMRTNPSNSSGK